MKDEIASELMGGGSKEERKAGIKRMAMNYILLENYVMKMIIHEHSIFVGTAFTNVDCRKFFLNYTLYVFYLVSFQTLFPPMSFS